MGLLVFLCTIKHIQADFSRGPDYKPSIGPSIFEQRKLYADAMYFIKSGQRSEENNSVKKASRNSMVKTGHKKSGINSKTQEKTSVVAEKASAEDVLGPESGVETKTRKSSKVESKD